MTDGRGEQSGGDGASEADGQFLCSVKPGRNITSQSEDSGEASLSSWCFTPNQPARFTQGESGEETVHKTQQVFNTVHRLVGLVVEVSASRVKDPEFDSRLRRDFCGSSHTSDLKISIQVVTLPGAWYNKVHAGSGWPSVSVL